MKYPTLAIAAVGLALAAPAWAQTTGPAMKAENSMTMESHDKMAGTMAMPGEKKDAMKPMAMKKADKQPMDAMKGDTKDMKDMKH